MKVQSKVVANVFAALLAMLLYGNPALVQAVDRPADVETGKYLSRIAGCNDCHTPGYLLSEGQTPEEQWLTGDSFGWRGPWGTTYASNLRALLQGLDEEQWLILAKSLKARPPMPWFNLNIMKDEDLRAIYAYIRHLGPGGGAVPAYVPPEREPNPPYALFPSPPSQ